jgi:hypothetical protein
MSSKLIHKVSINWEVYDLFESFSAFEAAHLWFELEPVQQVGYVPPCHINKMVKLIMGGDKDVFGSAQHHPIARSKLKELAEKLNTKPKFLFSESRKRIDLPAKSRNSYLKLIKGLLVDKGIDPGERGIAKQLKGMVQHADESLGDDAIRGILEEVKNLDEH